LQDIRAQEPETRIRKRKSRVTPHCCRGWEKGVGKTYTGSAAVLNVTNDRGKKIHPRDHGIGNTRRVSFYLT
jgi:hypothetical protein